MGAPFYNTGQYSGVELFHTLGLPFLIGIWWFVLIDELCGVWVFINHFVDDRVNPMVRPSCSQFAIDGTAGNHEKGVLVNVDRDLYLLRHFFDMIQHDADVVLHS